MQPEDRAYLVRLTSSVTGLSEADASRRVDDVSARAKQNIDRARRAGIVLGFMIGASALVGAVAAWLAAIAAGRHRDGREALPDIFDWGKPMGRPRLTF
jgi:predicted transcriptional regulator